MSNPYAPPEDRPRESAQVDTETRGGPTPGPDGPPDVLGPAGPPDVLRPAEPEDPARQAVPEGPAPRTGTPYAGPAALSDRSPAGVPYERLPGSRSQSPAADPKDVRRLAVLVRTTTLLVVLTLLVDLLPFPWFVAAAALAAAGLVVGGRALVVAARTHQRTPRAAVILLVVLAVIGLTRPGAALLTWDAESQYAHCQSGALTLQARNACLSQYQQALDDRAAALTHRTP